MGLHVRKIVALDDVTANATSNALWVGDFKKVGVLLRRSAHTSGSSNFLIRAGFGENGADTNVTMSALNTMIDNVTNTNGQTLTRVNGKALSANGDAFLWVSPETPVTHLQVIVNEGTDGTHRAEIFGWE